METIIKLVRPDAMTSLITEWCDDKSSAGEGLFLTREKKNGKPIYTACDNSEGDCWVEDFRDWKTAVLWLLGKLGLDDIYPEQRKLTADPSSHFGRVEQYVISRGYSPKSISWEQYIATIILYWESWMEDEGIEDDIWGSSLDEYLMFLEGNHRMEDFDYE